MTMHMKFPKIGQFKDVVRHIRQRVAYNGKDALGNALYINNAPFPAIEYTGTVKLHGTNASIVYDVGRDKTYCQSRNRVLSPGPSDNINFAASMTELGLVDMDCSLFHAAVKCFDVTAKPCAYIVYGEWCGSNIQKSVALTELERMFVIFGVAKITPGDEDSTEYAEMCNLSTAIGEQIVALNDQRVFLIDQFPSFSLTIDFARAADVQNQLVEITNQVEQECPVGKYFGVTGTGEGVVWQPVDSTWKNDNDTWFKVKGEKHSVSKVKKLASIDPERIRSMEEFVIRTVTQNRLEQGIQYLREMNKKLTMSSTGFFMAWVVNDILEEEADVVADSPYAKKDFTKALNHAVKGWWMDRINNEL